MSDWAPPDFSDPRFEVIAVRDAATCRHEACENRADFLVEYSMRREPWTYEYECGYCVQHLPKACIDALIVTPEGSEQR